MRAHAIERGLTTTSSLVPLKIPKLKGKALSGVRTVAADKATAMTSAISEAFPESACQSFTVHFYRNVLAKAPKPKRRAATAMPKTKHSQESFDVSMEKARAIATSLEAMKLKEEAKYVRDSIAETLTDIRVPMGH